MISIQEGIERWSETRRLLRLNKRSEYLTRHVTEEEQYTKQLIAALLEFGMTVADEPNKVQACLTTFLQARGIEADLAPDFQWEGKCLKTLEEVMNES